MAVYRTLVSLFSGCGGLDLGFHRKHFKVAYACDNFEAAVNVFKGNIDENCFLKDVESEEFRSDIKFIGKADIVLGGFPCQGFSKAGSKKKEDSRNTLYKSMLWTINQLHPKLFVAENVDGLSQNFGGSILDQILNDFKDIGYSVEYKIVDMAWYGAPQHRRRIIFIGTKTSQKKEFKWPIPKHDQLVRNGEFSIDTIGDKTQSSPVRTIKDAIEDLIETDSSFPDHKVTNKWPSDYNLIMKSINEDQKLCNVRHSKTSVYTWDIPEVFGEVSNTERQILEVIGKNRRHKKYGNIPNGNPLSKKTIEGLSGLSDIEIEVQTLLQKGYLKEKNGGYDLKGAMFCSGLFKKPLWDKPSPTVLTNFHNPRYFIHPRLHRPFTLRECARLQTFPDNFHFEQYIAKLQDGYTLIGNAVPPLFAEQLAEAVNAYLDQLENIKKSRYEVTATL